VFKMVLFVSLKVLYLKKKTCVFPRNMCNLLKDMSVKNSLIFGLNPPFGGTCVFVKAASVRCKCKFWRKSTFFLSEHFSL